MKICLLTPGHLSMNPRIVKEADALSAAGHDVTVIAADFVKWARAADAEFLTRVWRPSKKLRFGPGTPLTRRIVQVARQRTARALWRVGVKNAVLAQAACHPIASDLVRAACSVRCDLYVAHYTAALPAAARAAARFGGKYAFDAEDFHLGDLADVPENAVANELIRTIEGQYLPGCAYVTSASSGIANAYMREYGIPRPTTVLNVFSLKDSPSEHTAFGTAPKAPSIYWFSQTVGPDRGLECAIRAVGLAKSMPHLHLRGMPTSGYTNRLTAIADRAGCLDRLHLLPPANPADMVRLASPHDIGLVGETGATHNRRIALTNKQFTYLLAGLPILMSDVPAHRDFAAALGEAAHLYAVDDDVQLAQMMDEVLGDPARLAAARAHAWRLGQERYNWDMEKQTLLDVVDRSLAGQREAEPAEAVV